MNKKKYVQIPSLIIIAVIIFLVPIFVPGPYILHVLILTLINIILASSLRLINLTGQLSLAHSGMLTLGAYTCTLLVMKAGFSSWGALIVGAIFAAIVAILLGIPFTKLKGIYFSIITILTNEIITLVAQQWRGMTNGSNGIYNIPRPDPIVIPHILSITFETRTNFYYMVLIIAIISLGIMYAIEHSRVGMAMQGIKQSESLSASVGVNVTWYKVLGFALGCFFSGLTGGFYSQYISAIDPTTFGFIFAIYTVIYMVVGGQGKFIGPIIGAFILTLLPEVLRPLKEFQPYFFAAVLILIIFFLPKGLVGLPEWWQKTRKRLTGKKDAYA
jgi:branched-chain amino acid transport system permease protein